MRVAAVIVAAGRGSRAGEGLPKQYRDVAGRPVLRRTLATFLSHPGIDRVICAIHPDDAALYEAAVAELDGRSRLLAPVHGAATRQGSVRAALEGLAAGDDGICLVHDAARMFVDAALIDRAIEAGRLHGAAVPVLAVTDTVKRVGPDGRVVETLDRALLRSVQTPQAFAAAALRQAHARAHRAGLDAFTDDAGLAEWAGLAVATFPGDIANMKVTHPGDFAESERRLAGREPVAGTEPLAGREPALLTRLGTGFDVHVFGPGDHIWLGGVRIPHESGIVAHSDGDVVLHALTDAVLGTMGDGDIGTHFPPSDPRWRGASSDRFLAFAVERVSAMGGIVDHLDVTVLCERPRVGPHRAAMQARIAAVAGIDLASVSIKATTTEGLGFTGRGEGIVAQAAATVRLPVR